MLPLVQVLGAGSLGGGDLGAGSLGAGSLGASGGSADCSTGTPLIDYDVREFTPQTDDTPLNTTIPNQGTGGSGWDLTTYLSGGADYRTSANCAGVSTDCFEYEFGAKQYMSSTASATWTVTIQCFVVKDPEPSSNTFSFPLGWTDASTSEYLRHDDSIGWRVAHGGALEVFTTVKGQWAAICWDSTTPATTTTSVNGSAGTTIDIASGYADPDQIIFGSSSTGAGVYGNDALIGRYVAYNTDPGQSIDALSACLKTQFGF